MRGGKKCRLVSACEQCTHSQGHTPTTCVTAPPAGSYEGNNSVRKTTTTTTEVHGLLNFLKVIKYLKKNRPISHYIEIRNTLLSANEKQIHDIG